VQTIAAAEAYVIGKMLYFFQIPLFLSQEKLTLFIGDGTHEDIIKIKLPLLLQILFLIFFQRLRLPQKVH
jgi:hypothetical protein